MRDGKRAQSSPRLDDIRTRAKSELERLPEPLRRLETGAPYPVEIATTLETLAADVDNRLASFSGNMVPGRRKDGTSQAGNS
jgi:nicotinate phosphoribosyltransferase